MIWGGANVIIIEIKCIVTVMYLNHPETVPYPFVEKLSSRKLVPGARKIGDHCYNWYINKGQIHFENTIPSLQIQKKLEEGGTERKQWSLCLMSVIALRRKETRDQSQPVPRPLRVASVWRVTDGPLHLCHFT